MKTAYGMSKTLLFLNRRISRSKLETVDRYTTDITAKPLQFICFHVVQNRARVSGNGTKPSKKRCFGGEIEVKSKT
jgi:hypothetical protein